MKLICLLLCTAVAGLSYSYHGTIRGITSANLTLVSATVGANSHAAVWEGVSNGRATRWVQAGIAYEGGQPEVYIEVKAKTLRQRFWPITFGTPVTVRLTHSGHYWQVHVIGHHSTSLYIGRAYKMATLELYGNAHAVAIINGHKIIS